jgi:hypothetical protein
MIEQALDLPRGRAMGTSAVGNALSNVCYTARTRLDVPGVPVLCCAVLQAGMKSIKRGNKDGRALTENGTYALLDPACRYPLCSVWQALRGALQVQIQVQQAQWSSIQS